MRAVRCGEMGRTPSMSPMSAAYIPGYKGSGGSIGLADPNQGYTIAFTHNRLTAPPQDSAPHIPDRIGTALRPTNCPRATETGSDRPRISRPVFRMVWGQGLGC